MYYNAKFCFYVVFSQFAQCRNHISITGATCQVLPHGDQFLKNSYCAMRACFSHSTLLLFLHIFLLFLLSSAFASAPLPPPLPQCSSCDCLHLTGTVICFTIFYSEKTKKICQEGKCHPPLNPLMLHHTMNISCIDTNM